MISRAQLAAILVLVNFVQCSIGETGLRTDFASAIVELYSGHGLNLLSAGGKETQRDEGISSLQVRSFRI